MYMNIAANVRYEKGNKHNMKNYIEKTLGQRNNSTKAFNQTAEKPKWSGPPNQHYTGDLDINSKSIYPKANGLVGGDKEQRL